MSNDANGVSSLMEKESFASSLIEKASLCIIDAKKDTPVSQSIGLVRLIKSEC